MYATNKNIFFSLNSQVSSWNCLKFFKYTFVIMKTPFAEIFCLPDDKKTVDRVSYLNFIEFFSMQKNPCRK